MEASSHAFTTFQHAREEAERCLYCFDAPCTAACPVHIDVPTFIAMIRSGNVLGSAEVVKSSNPMANVCGKICPEEIYCQSVCNRSFLDKPIRIRDLHRFVTEQEARSGYRRISKFPPRPASIAVVGAGPSGLGCAFELSRRGYCVTVFDKTSLGGVPRNSIPAFRLSTDELNDDLKFLSKNFKVVKKDIDATTFAKVKRKFDAIYIAIGLGKDRSIHLGGESLKGVIPVIKFLEAAKRGKASVGSRVVVIGGGNVSLDAAASAKRLGARQVILIYRRSQNEMKVWKSELEEAQNQGVEVRFLTAPVGMVGTRTVTGVRCVRTKLSRKKDASSRAIPVEVKGSVFEIEADTVIIAIGQVIGSDISKVFKLNSKDLVVVNKEFRTSVPGVFAGGDAISGEGTVVQSVAHGKEAALAIDRYLQRKGGRIMR